MATARAEFSRRWGDRPNQDFWRIRTRGENQSEVNIAATPATPTDATATEPELTPQERMQAQVNTYLQDIPLTTAALMRSERQVEEALFRLGGIYAQNLKAPAEAIETYEQLLQRYPLTEHAAETYYSLYLLYGRTGNEAQQQVYFSKIKGQFPNTVYARLIEDEDFMKKNASDNLLVHALYDSAYAHFDAQEFSQTSQLLNQISRQYPLNDIQDKIAYLDAMVAARTEKPEVLYEKLNRFKNQYKGSPLMAKANQLLATYEDLQSKNQLRTDAPAAPTPRVTIDKRSPEEKVSIEIAQATASIATPAPALKERVPASQQEQPVVAEPVGVQEPQQATLQAQVTLPDVPVAPAAAPDAPAIDPLAYTATADSAFYFVLIYPSDAAAFKDIIQKYEKYNSTYYKKQNLAIDSVGYQNGQSMLVMRAFQDPALATSFNIKQKAPQAPVGRIRGVDFTTFVISSANYNRFIQKKDLEAYLTFFKNNY
ncbi:hypothetical protein GCM10028895_32050 [Pontibacter rugosus]